MRREITPEDLALYAMHLLDGEDRYAVQLYVENSPEALREVATLRGDLAVLALSAQQEMPRALAKQRVLKQAMRERRPVQPVYNDYPVEQEDSYTPSAAATEDRILSPSRSDDPPLLKSFGYASSSRSEEEDDYDEKPARETSPMVWIVGGLGWATAIALGVMLFNNYRQVDSLNGKVHDQNLALSAGNDGAERAQLIVDTLTSNSAQRFVLAKEEVKLPATARISYLPDRGSLLFLGDNLSPLPGGKVYQLWMIPTGTKPSPIAAGTFRPDPAGNAQIILPEMPKGVTASKFGVTIENDGGAVEPSLPIVMIGQQPKE